jgi:hypothetical protein
MRFFLPLSLTCCLLLIHTVEARELKDDSFGFQCEIPDQFKTVPGGAEKPNNLYVFANPLPGPNVSPLIIQIQRLHGTIDPAQKLRAPDVKDHIKYPSVVTEEDFPWKGQTLGIIRTVSDLPNGFKMVGYSIQYPLAKEAVQLQVAGEEKRDADVRKLFNEVAGSFNNLHPLYSSGGRHLVMRKALFDQLREAFTGVPFIAIAAGALTLLIVVVGAVIMAKR